MRRIEITGAQRVSAAKAAAALRARFLGHNLFTISAADVAAALKAFPYLAGVRVDRDFPDTLRVQVVEYKPLALLTVKGRWYVLSTQGRVLVDVTPKGSTVAKPVSPPQACRSPVVSSRQAVKPGQMIADVRVCDALALLRALPQAMRTQIAEVRASSTSLRLATRGGLRVEFGDAHGLAEKVLALRVVLAAYRRYQVRPTFVDVSVPDRPLGAPLLVADRSASMKIVPSPSFLPTATPATD